MFKINGFSLIELLVVVAIIGVLSVVSVGAYRNYTRTTNMNIAANYVVWLMNQSIAWADEGHTAFGNASQIGATTAPNMFGAGVPGVYIASTTCPGAGLPDIGVTFDGSKMGFAQNTVVSVSVEWDVTGSGNSQVINELGLYYINNGDGTCDTTDYITSPIKWLSTQNSDCSNTNAYEQLLGYRFNTDCWTNALGNTNASM